MKAEDIRDQAEKAVALLKALGSHNRLMIACQLVEGERSVGELASVNGVVSPGAEYLRSKRTWQGLGTDFDEEASTLIEEGRSGIARGYKVGDEEGKH